MQIHFVFGKPNYFLLLLLYVSNLFQINEFDTNFDVVVLDTVYNNSIIVKQ